MTTQLWAKAVIVKTGTLTDATIIASASRAYGEAAWAGHQRRRAIHGFKANVSADAETALVEALAVTSGNVHDGLAGGATLPENRG
nr:transposase [Pseudoroseomonas aestuarii]